MNNIDSIPRLQPWNCHMSDIRSYYQLKLVKQIITFLPFILFPFPSRYLAQIHKKRHPKNSNLLLKHEQRLFSYTTETIYLALLIPSFASKEIVLSRPVSRECVRNLSGCIRLFLMPLFKKHFSKDRCQFNLNWLMDCIYTALFYNQWPPKTL